MKNRGESSADNFLASTALFLAGAAIGGGTVRDAILEKLPEIPRAQQYIFIAGGCLAGGFLLRKLIFALMKN